jgi:hypothetical protein
LEENPLNQKNSSTSLSDEIFGCEPILSLGFVPFDVV